jgi:hypothetical protein
MPYMACKGYLSASEAWRAGRRFEEAITRGKKPVLFHLGDHDPSGLDMTRDNGVRLEMFARMGVEVRRLALNMDQIEELGDKIPPNPAKQTDIRFAGYQAQFGDSSWELDALHPKAIDDILDEAIQSVLDPDVYAETLEREREERFPLMLLGKRWEEVRKLVTRPEADAVDRLDAIDALRRTHPNALLRSLPTPTVYQLPDLSEVSTELQDEPDDEDEDLYDVEDPLDPTVED